MEKETGTIRFKTLPILGLILILLVLYLFFLEIPSEKMKTEKEAESKKVLVFKEDEIKGYEIKSDLYSISVERDDNGTWKIIVPIKTDPDTERISRFISLLENIEVIRIVEEKPADLKRYGLDKPEMEILLKLKDREEGLMLGDRGPVINTLYIKRGRDGKILLVEDRLIEEIPDKFSVWRRAKVLPFDLTAVNKISLEYRNRSFLIIKENDKWVLKNPVETVADQAEVNGLLSSLSLVSARDFIDEGKEDLIKKLSGPILKVNLNVSEEEKTVSFYTSLKPEKGIAYAVISSEEAIYKIDELLLRNFDKDLYKLRDKRILDIDEHEVQEIEITKKDETFKISRVQEDWVIDGRSNQKIDTSKVVHLLDSLKDVKVERFIDDVTIDLSRYGLNTPNRAINLYDKDNKLIGAILFGKEKGDMVYVKNEKSRSIFTVKKETLGSIPGTKDLVDTNRYLPSKQGER